MSRSDRRMLRPHLESGDFTVTTAAYWPRTLAWFLVYGRETRLTYISRSGIQKTWTGQLLGLGRGA